MLNFIACLMLSLSSFAAFAAPPPGEVGDEDARAVRAVVEAQLQAFAADDPVRAFEQASPAIRRQFGDAATFARMVQQAYPMLIRPTSVSFYRPQASDAAITLAVLFRDRDGHLWRAVYLLARQADRHWRIEACQVAPGDDVSTT